MRIELRRKPLACQGNHSLLILNLLQVLIIGVTEYVIFPMQKMDVEYHFRFQAPKKRKHLASSALCYPLASVTTLLLRKYLNMALHFPMKPCSLFLTSLKPIHIHILALLFDAHMCGNPEDHIEWNI
jgi:hypothetical protein